MEESQTEKQPGENNAEVEGRESGGPLPPVSILDWIRFVPFILSFVAILLFYDPLQRIAMLFGVKYQQVVVHWLNSSLRASLNICGVRVQVDGVDSVPENEPLIIISNHQSMFDIPILHSVFYRHRPRFIAKQELGKWIPSVSFNLRAGGSALIDRTNARQALPEIQRLADRLTEQKYAAIIFPEGTRAKEGTLKKFRPAGMSTLIQGAPTARIQLAVIDNSWILSARKKGPIPAGTVVRVRILSELDRTGMSAKALVEKAESEIDQALQALRKEKAEK